MFSPTEERLRVFIEKLSSALTEGTKVVVRPGDAWSAYPDNDPPILTFRLADVGAIGDEILAVTGHEIAHLLYTKTDVKWKFDVGKFPKSAHLLLNAVEDSRIEQLFAEAYPGARSLFDRKQENVYDGKVQRGFEDLPIKWRYVLNIDRVLHGLEPWGDQRDLDAVEAALDPCLRGMWAKSTQECADELEVPFRIMIELMKQEKLEADDPDSKAPHPSFEVPPELLGLPEDYMTYPDMDDEDPSNPSVSGESGTPADADDHQTGGTDGTAGKRQQGDGPQGDGTGKGEGQKGEGTGSSSAGSKKMEGMGTDASQSSGAGGGPGKEDKSQFGSPYTDGLGDSGTTGPDATGTKTTNIIEEMVEEQKAQGSKNKTIDILSFRQRQRAKDAKELEKKIEKEREDFWKKMSETFGTPVASKAMRDRLLANKAAYEADMKAMELEIRTLRSYARMVVRDNDTKRFGGNFTSGRKIKTHRLSRMYTDDPRLMERREDIGGKSYAVSVVVDQSGSMRSGGKQALAYRSCIVFLEAFEGLVDTSVIGFSDIGFSDPVVHHVPRHRRYYTPASTQGYDYRTYKPAHDELKVVRPLIPELGRSYGSTPMEVGVSEAVRQLDESDKDVRAIMLITDGEPNSAPAAARAIAAARKKGYKVYGMYIGARSGAMPTGVHPGGLQFLIDNCDRAVSIPGISAIPTSVNSLLRGIVRRRTSVV